MKSKEKSSAKNPKNKHQQQRKKGQPKWKNVVAEIETLKKRIQEEVPPSGVLYYKYKKQEEGENEQQQQDQSKVIANRKVMETDDKSKIKIRFSDLPISKSTTSGLFKSKFIKMTEVQRAAIPHAIAGRDMVVCARTGSGKTLSYLIPVIEKLYHERWSSYDGLGALILVPTRELAIQAFEVLRSFGGMHDMSAGLVIGGKDLKFEQERIKDMNILICTPGRLLQHMNETATFDGSNMKIMVIDEVDRLLDMGFKETIDQIMRNLPKAMQIMLFSATIGKTLKEMMRVNLKKEHEYICIHDFDSIESLANDYNPKESTQDKALTEQLKSITPVKLLHYYMIINLEEKLDTLFSFIKSHQNSKCLVFFSACKEVRFAYEAFKRLKLGISLLELHGRQKQAKRTAIYFEFVERKTAVLFATDIASRGIDFPAVDWVIQYDCPEDIYTYIHRVGRTARYKSKGNSLLFITPSEQKFVEKVQQRGIQLKKLGANPNRSLTIQPTLQKMNAENRDLKHLAEKACISYIKSVYLMRDKEVFQFQNIDPEKLALSLGLATTPQISFKKSQDKNISHQNDNEDQEQNGESGKFEPKLTRLQKLKLKIKAKKDQKKKTQDKDSEQTKLVQKADNDEEEEEEDFFTSKQNNQDGQLFDSDQDDQIEQQQLKREELKVNMKKLKKITKDGPFQGKNKIFYDGNGKEISSLEYHLFKQQQEKEQELRIIEENDVNQNSSEEEKFVSKVKKTLAQNQVKDTTLARDKLTEQRLKKKRKLKKLQNKGEEEDTIAILGAHEEESELEQQNYNDEQQSEQEEEEIQKPKKSIKRQKVDKTQKNTEERALELLNNLDDDF